MEHLLGTYSSCDAFLSSFKTLNSGGFSGQDLEVAFNVACLDISAVGYKTDMQHFHGHPIYLKHACTVIGEINALLK